MNSTPILAIYVQLWPILTTHQHWIFPLNQLTIFTELPLLYSHLLLIKGSYPAISSITSKWEKPSALLKSLIKLTVALIKTRGFSRFISPWCSLSDPEMCESPESSCFVGR